MKKSAKRHKARPSYGKSVTGQTGFSLLELLTVLFLLALIAGIAAPATGRFLDNLNFRKQTADILATLRYARLMSISRGKEVRIKPDAERGRILYLAGAVEETKDFGLDNDSYFTLEPPRIVFYPEGYATPALLTSVKGDRSQLVALDPLTGLPIVQ